MSRAGIDWQHVLRDPPTRRRILKRLLRMEQGHYGDAKPVGGGDKSSQRRDIHQAQAYWQEYKSND